MEAEVRIKLKPGAKKPRYQTSGSSGADLHAHLARSITLAAGQRALIPTGVYLEIPSGLEVQIRPRSGLALHHGITVLNSPGTIDCDYRGELKVLLINLGDKDVEIAAGERIAQLVVAPVIRAQLVETEEIGESLRGENGFGHTGKE